jgi:hypothetical protein
MVVLRLILLGNSLATVRKRSHAGNLHLDGRKKYG